MTAEAEHGLEWAARALEEGTMQNWIDWLERLEKAHRQGDDRYPDALAMLCLHGRKQQFETISRREDAQGHYVAMRLEGVPHKTAEMLCMRQPPMSNTDREFLEGRGGCYDQFAGQNPLISENYASQAKRARVSTTGKIYLSGLARFPGDPEAWVSGRGDLKDRLEERGWGSQGAVNVKAREAENPPEPDTAVAGDILDDAVCGRIEEDPSLAHMDQAELRHETEAIIKPHWAR